MTTEPATVKCIKCSKETDYPYYIADSLGPTDIGPLCLRCWQRAVKKVVDRRIMNDHREN